MSKRYDDGIELRRQVMGDVFVERALDTPTAFAKDWQDLITEYAWGTVWKRPGLDLKSRSLVTLALLTALGRNHELRGHLRGALNNGASPTEIREVLMHAAIYCGIPLAGDALRCAEEILGDT